MKVKPANEWADNYVQAAPIASQRYGKGVTGNTDFLAKAKAGQGNYVTQMSNPNVLARRDANLDSAAEQKWKKNASGPGQTRLAPGMIAARAEVAAAAQVSASAIAGVTDAPRTLDPDTNVQNRLLPVIHALRRAWGKE